VRKMDRRRAPGQGPPVREKNPGPPGDVPGCAWPWVATPSVWSGFRAVFFARESERRAGARITATQPRGGWARLLFPEGGPGRGGAELWSFSCFVSRRLMLFRGRFFFGPAAGDPAPGGCRDGSDTWGGVVAGQGVRLGATNGGRNRRGTFARRVSFVLVSSLGMYRTVLPGGGADCAAPRSWFPARFWRRVPPACTSSGVAMGSRGRAA